MRVLCPNRDHIPHLGSVAHTSVPSLYSHHGTQKKKETVSPALWGWGRERTVIMTTQGSSPLALPGFAAQSWGWRLTLRAPGNRFMAGQLGTSALNHTPDIRPFRELLIQITSFPHRLQARRWAGDLSCPCSLSFCLAVTHGQPVQSGPGG